MRIRRAVLVVCVAAFAAPFAAGDLIPGRPRGPIPKPEDKKETKLKIEYDEAAKGPKLFVPAPLAGGGAGKEEELAVNDAPKFHWIVAGAALTLGLSLGGVWFVRKGKSKSVAWAVAPILVVASATLLFADLPGNRGVRPRPPQVPSLPVIVDGTVTVEVIPAGDTIRLVLDKATWEKVKKDPAKPDAPKGPEGPKKDEE